ncbi:MAG: caspase family protein [Bacteroidales bacterium]|jgi:hypothetical protein|nr:caspase family protein [Bacteroidales bacterium]
MKKILIIIILLIFSIQLNAQTYIAENSKVDGIWTKENSPYIIMGEVTVPYGGVLKIKPGTEIHLKATEDMEKGVGTIIVYGTIKALGTHNNPIKFTKTNDPGKWGSISLSESDYSEFSYCILEHSGGQINIYNKFTDAWGAISIHESSPRISNTKISNSRHGIYCTSESSPTISECIIEYCISGIKIEKKSNVKIINSLITGSKEGIFSEYSYLTITNSNIVFNKKYGIYSNSNKSIDINKSIILENKYALNYNKKFSISESIIQPEIRFINKKNQLQLEANNIIGLPDENNELEEDLVFNKSSHVKTEINNKKIIIGSQIEEIKAQEIDNSVAEELTTNPKSEAKKISKKEIEIDVDTKIPVTNYKDDYKFALIIGNEDYTTYQTNLSSEVNVDFAVNDAEIFAQYCKNTLGVPEENIFLLKNAIGTEIKREVNKISKMMMYTQGKAEVIFYYAGHGIPNETTKEAYIMPVDVSAQNIDDGVKLSWLYEKLTEYDAKQVLVFLDACFTGGARNQGLLATRGVKIKPKENIITGNCIAFTSSSDIQSSLPYKEKQHGMFTYYLLKKLQETKGNITLGELSDYLYENVALSSIKINSKEQTPKVLVSPALKDNWHNIKLIE